MIAATDGSAINNPNGPAGWAWYVSDDCWGSGGFPKASNQVAELFAVLAVVRAVPRDLPLLIRTDSQFAINVLTKWMAGWQRKNWTKADGKPVANLSLVKELFTAFQGRDIRMEWVRGHNGDRMNEIADRLCGAASKAVSRGEPVAPGPGWTGAPATVVGGASSRVRPGVSAGRGSSPAEKVLPVPMAERRASAPRTVAWSGTSVVGRHKQDTSPIGACPACDFPIHPITLECRCSK